MNNKQQDAFLEKYTLNFGKFSIKRDQMTNWRCWLATKDLNEANRALDLAIDSWDGNTYGVPSLAAIKRFLRKIQRKDKHQGAYIPVAAPQGEIVAQDRIDKAIDWIQADEERERAFVAYLSRHAMQHCLMDQWKRVGYDSIWIQQLGYGWAKKRYLDEQGVQDAKQAETAQT